MNDLSINTYEFYTVSKTGILRKICMRNTKKKKNSVRNTSCTRCWTNTLLFCY